MGMGAIQSIIKFIKDRPLLERMINGTLWNAIGTGFQRGLNIISFIIVARLVGVKGFGELGIIQNTAMMFQVFAGFGLGLTSTKYVAELRHSNPHRAGRIIGLSRVVSIAIGSISGVLMVMFSPLLCKKVLAAPHLVDALRVSAVMIFFGALNGAQIGVLIGLEAFSIMAFINIVSGIANLIIIVCFTYWRGVNGAVYGLTLGMVLNWFMSMVVLKKEARRSGISIGNVRKCMEERSTLWNFSIPAVLSGLILTPTIWYCNALLVNSPNGYYEMGIFNAANQWRMAILFLPSVTSTAVLPLLSHLFGEENRDRYDSALRYSLLSNMVIAIIGAFIVIVFSPISMGLYGEEFARGTTVFNVLALSAVVTAFTGVIGQAIVSSGRIWYGFMFNFLWACAIICLTLFLVPLKGALGLACAFLGAYLLHSIWQSIYLKRVLRKRAALY